MSTLLEILTFLMGFVFGAAIVIYLVYLVVHLIDKLALSGYFKKLVDKMEKYAYSKKYGEILIGTMISGSIGLILLALWIILKVIHLVWLDR
jgi:hypothetical protein